MATITSDVSITTTLGVGTSKIEEPPVAIGPATLTSSISAYASSSTVVEVLRPFTYGVIKANPNVFGHLVIDNQTPKYWFQWNNAFVIDPLPDDTASYLMMVHRASYPSKEMDGTYYKAPNDLPEEFHSLLIDFACYVLLIKLKKWRQASKYYNRYMRNLNAKRQEYVNRKAEERKLIKLPDEVIYSNGKKWEH